MRLTLLILCSFCLKLFAYSSSELIDHVQKSIDFAILHKSKLDPSLLQIYGMSSEKNRHFLNNVCSLPGINYLEIGVWRGSTFFSALYKNFDIRSATAVENWSLNSDTRGHYFSNKEKYKNQIPHNIKMIEENCFEISLNHFRGPIQIYFYDGRHEEEDQRKAFTYFDSVLDDVFIAIVDDFNHPPVPVGTKLAFEELGYEICHEWILPARMNGDLDLWWNGLYIAVIKKHSNRLKSL